jgi:hypothetical protein
MLQHVVEGCGCRLQSQPRGGGIGGMPAAADGGFGGGMAGGGAVAGPLGGPGAMAAPAAAAPPQRRHYGVEQVRRVSPAGEFRLDITACRSPAGN